MIIPPERAHMLRSLKDVERIGKDTLTVRISDHFKVPLTQFPCITCFEHPASRETYCFCFRQLNNAEELADALRAVIALAREVVADSDIKDDSEDDLRRRRVEMMGRLAPRLRRAKIFRSFRKLFMSRAMTNVARIGSGLS